MLKQMAIVSVSALIVSGCTNGSPHESTNKRSSEVGSGNPDSTIHPYVGGLTEPFAGADPSCSAVLVTPTWAITANHCIDSVTESVDVVFAEVPASVDVDPRRVHHTDAIGGHIFVRESEISGASQDDSAHDIALLQLDRRVASSIAVPVHPAGAGGTPTCGDSFDGTLVGYGKTVFTGQQPHVHVRNYHESDGWESEDTSAGNATYTNFWDIIGLTFDNYTGALGGDSGGALLDASGRLCGITSRYTFASGFPLPNPELRTDTARLESLENGFWISNILVDPKTGTFRGECAGTGDGDHDGIPDSCDNCPPRRRTTPRDARTSSRKTAITTASATSATTAPRRRTSTNPTSTTRTSSS